MEITLSREQGRVSVTIVSIEGEINAETSSGFLAAIHEAHAAGAHDFLLDMSRVPYVTSWGVRALSDIYSMLREEDPHAGAQNSPRSKHLKLLNPTTQVRKVLATAGLDMYLETFTDRRSAIASF